MGDPVTVIDNNPDVIVDKNVILVKADNESPSIITILNNNTAEVTVVEQITEVTVQGMSPSIIVEYGGTRGPIYTPEAANFGPNELLAYLVNAVESSHLSGYLRAQIDYSTTGLAEAREDLTALVEASGVLEGRVDVAETYMTQTDYAIEQIANRVTSTEAGEIVAIQTQFTQTAEDIAAVATQYDTAENLITAARLDIDSTSIRMTVAEESIDETGLTLISQMELLSNQWTVKIQEGTDNNYYAAGFGLTVYPDWVEGKNYYVGDWVMFDSLAYKCTNDHTSSDVFGPYWIYMPGGVKSTFGVLADQFFIQGASGQQVVPFIVDVATNTIILNSDTITSGVASFISYNDISDTPLTLSDVSASEVLAWDSELNSVSATAYSASDSAATAQTKADLAKSIADSANTVASDAQTYAESVYTYAQGKVAADQVAWAINNNTTLIDGAKIITGSLSANSIYTSHIIIGGVDTSNLAAQSVNQLYFVGIINSSATIYVTLNANYPVFIMGSLSQTYTSGLTLTRNGTEIWAGAAVTGTQATTGVVDYPGVGTHNYTFKSLDTRNSNYTSLYIAVTKR